MHEVLGEEDPQIPPDGARRRRARIGRADQGANDLPRVLRAFQHERRDGPATHELDKVGIKALTHMLFVVASQRVGIQRAHVEGDDREVLGFEARKDLADEATLDCVGLEENESAIRHGLRGYREAPRLRERALQHLAQVRPGTTHDVEGAGDQDRIVDLGHRQCLIDGVPDRGVLEDEFAAHTTCGTR